MAALSTSRRCHRHRHASRWRTRALKLSRGVREVAPGIVVGGHPTRVLRLAPGAHLSDEAVLTLLERRGLAHAEPPAELPAPDLTVVIPVKDNPQGLSGAVAALGDAFPLVVVDDGSAVPVPGATVRHSHPRGPAAARQAALSHVTTSLVAFVDSDVTINASDLRRLAWWFAHDQHLAAAAPRISGTGPWRCPLDLGPEPALVAPLSDVGYLPSACLMMRRSAWVNYGFDPDLRYGEDVDLIWRLIAAGHRVRYDPGAQATHTEPALSLRLKRAHQYGTSAAVLHELHGDWVAPLVVSPVHVIAVLTRSPVLVGFAAGRLAQRLHGAGAPPQLAASLTGKSLLAAASGLGAYTTKAALPLAVRTWPLVALPHLRTWWRWRPPTDPVTWTLTGLVEDVAYGTGVWRAALMSKSFGAVKPVLGSTIKSSSAAGRGSGP